MFYLSRIRTTERIKPKELKLDIKETIFKKIKEKYEGLCSPEFGDILYITKITNIEGGEISWGDGEVIFDVEFEALTLNFTQNETVICVADEIDNLGIFANLGGFKGLIHISQIFEGKAEFDRSSGKIKSESGEEIKLRDVLRAKITGVSIRDNVTNSRIHLTMRQPGLGKVVK